LGENGGSFYGMHDRSRFQGEHLHGRGLFAGERVQRFVPCGQPAGEDPGAALDVHPSRPVANRFF
jgi:hypothetical protein